MKYLKILGLAAVAAMALTAILGAGTASATGLWKYTTPSANDSVGTPEIVSSLKPTTSAVLKDTGGSTNDTCTTSEVKGKIEKDTGSEPPVNPQGRISTLTFGGCTHTTHPLVNADGFFGELEIKNIAGTTNGTVISRSSRVTVQSTVFGISCTANTGGGVTLGTLTGSKTSTTTPLLVINAVISLGALCGDSTWTGEYLVTSPTGLTVEAS